MSSPETDPQSTFVALFLTRRLVLIALVAFTFASIGGCQKATATVAETPPPEVIVQLPTRDDVLEVEETTGRLVAREAVEIRSRVSGYLDKAFFADGANVQEGQPLFQIDARPYDAELARAKANVEQTKA